jgi:predicted PilT family ATPase
LFVTELLASCAAGFLIAGASGSGKSMLVNALSNQLRALVDVASPAIASPLSMCTIVFPCSLYANDSVI